MPEFTFEESTFERVVEKAERELGTKREALNIEVVEEKDKGFLGIKWGKVCKIKVSQKTRQISSAPEAAEMASETLKKLLELSGLKGDVEVSDTAEELILDVKVDSDSESLFIGKRGKNLDAYQYIVNKIVDSKIEERVKRIVLDCQGYRSRRVETLERMARKAASEVKNSNKSYTFPPMRASDRRIIHITMKEEGLETESRGRGDEKKVYVLPTNTV